MTHQGRARRIFADKNCWLVYFLRRITIYMEHLERGKVARGKISRTIAVAQAVLRPRTGDVMCNDISYIGMHS
jgi:hypothetical protein